VARGVEALSVERGGRGFNLNFNPYKKLQKLNRVLLR